MSDSKKCPACGAYQRLGMLCMKCARAAASAPDGFEIELGTAAPQPLNDKPSIVMTTPRAGMSLGTDYFGIEGPSCVEWVKEEQAPFVGFVHHQLDPNMITVPMAQMREWQNRIEALRAEVNAHGLKFETVISHPDGQEAKAGGRPVFGCRLEEFRDGYLAKWTPPSADMVMTELEDPDGMLNQGLADALDARELELRGLGAWPQFTEQEIATLLEEVEENLAAKPMTSTTFASPSPNDVEAKCFPYLQEDVYIPSCEIVGKGATDCCKHLIGRLDYCGQCEHEHDEPIDLTGETI
ncbi:hypothetical protein [Aeromonas phage 32]|nr:hypothetical protein [Aeromonas phage 32]